MADDTLLSVGSYNCWGFNKDKAQFVTNLMSQYDALLLQEHWLSDGQMSQLSLNANISYLGMSGFDDRNVLGGRPYGGCAILWRSNLDFPVTPIQCDSRRL